MIYGVGINDSSAPVSQGVYVGGKYIEVWKCPQYVLWRDMLKRCYSGKYPSYNGCEVCPEWLTFSNFKEWLQEEGWKPAPGICLDKDFLGDGKLYSPQTCCFIPSEVNCAIISGGSLGLAGVSFHKKTGKFQSRGSSPEGSVYLGLYSTQEEAHTAWQKHKCNRLNEILLKYPDLNKKVVDRMRVVISNIENDNLNGRTTSYPFTLKGENNVS